MARIILFYVLPLALVLYAVIDCVADDDVERTGVPKSLWVIIIIFIPLLGSLAWFAVSRIAKPKTRPVASPPGTLPRRTPRRPGPVAPDDNPDFLRRLAEDQARRERERRRREAKPDGEADDTGQPK